MERMECMARMARMERMERCCESEERLVEVGRDDDRRGGCGGVLAQRVRERIGILPSVDDETVVRHTHHRGIPERRHRGEWVRDGRRSRIEDGEPRGRRP
jgi:hypothetical protein